MAIGTRRGSRSTHDDQTSSDSNRGAGGPRGSGDDDRKLLLGLILAILAVVVLFGLALLLVLPSSDDDMSTTAASSSSAQGSGTSAGSGSLTADGRSLLPVPDDLSTSVGEDAEGRNVEVRSVVGDTGFFVGTSPSDRVYVEYGADVGENEASFTPRVGDRVDLGGPVRPAPDDPGGVLELNPSDSELVTQQGAYINADRVARAS